MGDPGLGDQYLVECKRPWSGRPGPERAVYESPVFGSPALRRAVCERRGQRELCMIGLGLGDQGLRALGVRDLGLESCVWEY